MKKIIENLWYGNINPCSDYYKNTKEKKELVKKRSDLYDKITTDFNKKQIELFENYEECNLDIIALNEKEMFEYSFRLGFNFAIELLKSD